jgi:hypothetical protein
MSVSPWWVASLMPDRWSVCGVSVHALSVWHLHALEENGNAFLCGGDITIDDVASLLMICRHDHQTGRALMMDESGVLRESKKITASLFGMDERDAIHQASDYVLQCLTAPDRWYDDKKSKGLSAPLSYHIVLCLCGEYRMSIDDAWNAPYVRARAMYEVWREKEGDDKLVSRDQQLLIDEANRIKESAKT